MRPWISKSTIHHTLKGLAGGDENGCVRSDEYLAALEDVRQRLGIDIDEDSLREESIGEEEASGS